jgi:hypothetical protein
VIPIHLVAKQSNVEPGQQYAVILLASLLIATNALTPCKEATNQWVSDFIGVNPTKIPQDVNWEARL